MTQASMGRAISRPLRFRCSSKGVPKAGFSAHLSRAANRPVRHAAISWHHWGVFFLPKLPQGNFFFFLSKPVVEALGKGEASVLSALVIYHVLEQE